MKKFDEWNKLKQAINQEKNTIIFKERDVFWASIGINVGY
jgi:hypothetical protein